MTTPPEIVAMLNWQRAHAGELAYSQTDRHRLASDAAHLTAPTDCSGLCIRLFRHFGTAAAVKELDGATYTGNLCQRGTLITASRGKAAAGDGMLPGDLVFFNWNGHNPTWDHVAMYAGGGRIWNHGGPGRGPNNWSLRDNVGYASEVMVRRYPTSRTTATPDQVHTAPTNPTKEFTVDAEAKARFDAIDKRLAEIENRVVLSGRRTIADGEYDLSQLKKIGEMQSDLAEIKAALKPKA